MRVKGEWLFASVVAWLLSVAAFIAAALAADEHAWLGMCVCVIGGFAFAAASVWWKGGAR